MYCDFLNQVLALGLYSEWDNDLMVSRDGLDIHVCFTDLAVKWNFIKTIGEEGPDYYAIVVTDKDSDKERRFQGSTLTACLAAYIKYLHRHS